MNKSQKSHAGEYVKLLSRAHDEIRKAAEVKKEANPLDVATIE